jgi:hypothetical protein
MNRRGFLGFLGLSLLSPLPLIRQAQAQASPRKIRLEQYHIAGFQYHQGVRSEVFARLRRGEPLVLAREPDNPYDGKAVAVLTRHGEKLGYVPRSVNGIPASLIDQHVRVSVEILAVRPDAPTWERVLIGLSIEA